MVMGELFPYKAHPHLYLQYHTHDSKKKGIKKHTEKYRLIAYLCAVVRDHYGNQTYVWSVWYVCKMLPYISLHTLVHTYIYIRMI